MIVAETQRTESVTAPNLPATAEVCCRTALEDFTQIVERRPDVDHEAMTQAIGKVIRLRDALIAERRRHADFPAARERLLQKVNALLSLTTSAEFPLVGVRWERIVAARDSLRELAAEEKTCRVKV